MGRSQLELVAFSEALVRGDDAAIAEARDGLVTAPGETEMMGAPGVASNFERKVRIADATGMPLGRLKAATENLHQTLAINAFAAESGGCGLTRGAAPRDGPCSSTFLRIGRVAGSQWLRSIRADANLS